MHCAIVLAATLIAVAAAKKGDSELPSPLLATLCRDQICDDAKFPILEYDQPTSSCLCSAHPCWNDNGKVHHCKGGLPNLAFSYTEEGKLECSCSAKPHYMSKFIAQTKCPGRHCDGEEQPMLDYDSQNRKCFCRTHPCANVDGKAHTCSDPKFPILNYREEKTDGGEVKKICECKQIIKAPNDEL